MIGCSMSSHARRGCSHAAAFECSAFRSALQREECRTFESGNGQEECAFRKTRAGYAARWGDLLDIT
ncbi:hypothetical protein NDU88_002493 [Pleurodeles waltl]|uniref:Uncharacterized protein n=1 Tax=Pleurodeles waltl TaxID=8319 RepID=A0AAV7T247_PLEWA|nr:hypothetical protein NDU88_002493 [Pleurodeles waltl]